MSSESFTKRALTPLEYARLTIVRSFVLDLSGS